MFKQILAALLACFAAAAFATVDINKANQGELETSTSASPRPT